MEAAATLYYLFALLVLSLGIGISSWIIFVSLAYPVQWLTPQNKTIVITGCDSGIGLQLAKHFYRKGCTIIATVVSKSSDGASQLGSECDAKGALHLMELDLNNPAQMEKNINDIKMLLEAHHLELHALVNNAGICVVGEFEFYTYGQIKDQININLLGTIYVTKQLLPYLIRNQGRIINVSSVNAVQSYPGLSVYSATKRALEGFSDSLRMELDKFNVKVINVRLGDYCKLTNIMKKHQQVVQSQYEQLDQSKRELYGDYFHRYHQTVLDKQGLFSPHSFEASTLFADFEEAILALKPNKYIFSSTLSYKLIIYFLQILPLDIREYLIKRFTNSMVEYKKAA